MIQFREMPKENQRKSRTFKIKQFFHIGNKNHSPEENKIMHNYAECVVYCMYDEEYRELRSKVERKM